MTTNHPCTHAYAQRCQTHLSAREVVEALDEEPRGLQQHDNEVALRGRLPHVVGGECSDAGVEEVAVAAARLATVLDARRREVCRETLQTRRRRVHLHDGVVHVLRALVAARQSQRPRRQISRQRHGASRSRQSDVDRRHAVEESPQRERKAGKERGNSDCRTAKWSLIQMPEILMAYAVATCEHRDTGAE